MMTTLNGKPQTVRWPDRIASLMVIRLVVWVMVATFSHEGILSDPFKVADWMDDHQFYSWEESDRTTLLRYHQLPAWNPYWCGGTVGIQAPEDPFLGPDFLLRLIFGVEHGRRLAIMLLVVIGFEGMYRLCRRLDASAVGSAFAAIIFGTCDLFPSFIHDGWVNFMGFETIPLILYFLIEGTYGPIDPEGRSAVEIRERKLRARLLGGFFVAWIVLSAGTYPTPYAMISVGYISIALSIRGFFAGKKTLEEDARAELDDEELGEDATRWARVRARGLTWARRALRSPWLAPWLTAMTIGVVALGLSAGKILPTLSFLRQFPRVFNPIETHQATEVFSGFWLRYAVILVLAFIGLVTADVAAGIFCGGAILFFALAMGDFGDLSPFHLMKSLPIFNQLRFPHRFAVGVLLFSSVAAARGITRVEDALPAFVKRGWERFMAWKTRVFGGPEHAYPPEMGWIIVGVAAFLAYSKVARPYAEEILPGVRIRAGTMYVQEAPRRYDGPFKQSRGNRRDVHLFTMANMGSIYCVAGNPLPESALLRGDLEQEEYAEDPSKATVKRLKWTPNEITLEVDAKEPTTVRINQNWAPQWRSDVGMVKSVDKLLAVDVPAGKSVVVLAYKDRFLDACLLVSLGTLLTLVYVFGRHGRRYLTRERARWQAMPTWPEEPSDEEIDRDAAASPSAAPAIEEPAAVAVETKDDAVEKDDPTEKDVDTPEKDDDAS